jgi:hypothetical protein
VKVLSSSNGHGGEVRVAWRVAGVHSRIVATDEIRAKDLTGCLITLLYSDEQILVVLLDKAGSINRLGDGTPSQSDKTLYIGVVREPIFDELIEVVPDTIFRYAGRMEARERRGIECVLTEAFFHKDGRVIPFEVLYGSESQGPPSELVTIVKRAIQLTDPWWYDQPRVRAPTQ